MTQHAVVTLLLTVAVAVLLFLAGVAPILVAAAAVAFFGLRNDV